MTTAESPRISKLWRVGWDVSLFCLRLVVVVDVVYVVFVVDVVDVVVVFDVVVAVFVVVSHNELYMPKN